MEFHLTRLAGRGTYVKEIPSLFSSSRGKCCIPPGYRAYVSTLYGGTLWVCDKFFPEIYWVSYRWYRPVEDDSRESGKREKRRVRDKIVYERQIIFARGNDRISCKSVSLPEKEHERIAERCFQRFVNSRTNAAADACPLSVMRVVHGEHVSGTLCPQLHRCCTVVPPICRPVPIVRATEPPAQILNPLCFSFVLLWENVHWVCI